MKKHLIITVIVLIAFNYCGFSQTPDSTLTYLSNLDLTISKNKPVDSFLAKIPTGYTQMKIYGSDHPKIAGPLAINYPNKVTVFIYVYKFQFMNKRSETMTWDINLFKKENVHHIEVWKAVDCYNGCPEGTLAQ